MVILILALVIFLGYYLVWFSFRCISVQLYNSLGRYQIYYSHEHCLFFARVYAGKLFGLIPVWLVYEGGTSYIFNSDKHTDRLWYSEEALTTSLNENYKVHIKSRKREKKYSLRSEKIGQEVRL